MAMTLRMSIGLIFALLALYAELAQRTAGPVRAAPMVPPLAARTGGIPANAPADPPAGMSGVDTLLEGLLAGDYEAEVEAHPALNGEEAPSARFAVSVRHHPDFHLQARGQAATSDEATPLAIEVSAESGRLSYTTSSLGEWITEDFEDPRQVYSLFGLIDDLGLLAEALAAGAPERTAPHAEHSVTVLPEERLVQRLLAEREEVIADRARVVYTVTELAGGALEVLSRLVYEVGEERYEIERVTRITPAQQRLS